MTLKRVETKRGHRYTLDGKSVPGVTTLLGKGLPKPALTYWAAKMVAEWVADRPAEVEQLRGMGRGPMVNALKGVPWEARDQAAIRGTDVHHLADRLIHGQEVEVPEHLTGHIEAYVAWLDAFEPEVILTERPVGSRKWWYAGTLDAILTLNGETWLVDWKTSGGVYGDSACQTAAYANADFYLDADGYEQPLPHIDRLGILHIRADGADLHPVTDADAAWKDALHIFWVGRAEDRIKAYLGEPMPAPSKAAVA